LFHAPERTLSRFASHQLRQLGDVGRDPPRLALGHGIGSRAPAGLILEIDVRQRMAVVVFHNKALHPARREAAACGHVFAGHHRAANKIADAPGMTKSKYKPTNEVKWVATFSGSPGP
jgi:hypothetical protein